MRILLQYTKRKACPAQVLVGRKPHFAVAGAGKTRIAALQNAAERLRKIADKAAKMADELQNTREQATPPKTTNEERNQST